MITMIEYILYISILFSLDRIKDICSAPKMHKRTSSQYIIVYSCLENKIRGKLNIVGNHCHIQKIESYALLKTRYFQVVACLL